jgi:hypothetical protein
MRWKLLIGAGAILGSLLVYRISSGETDTDGWVKFSSSEGRFEILMPGKPVTGKEVEIPLPKFTAKVYPFAAMRPSFGLMCGYADFKGVQGRLVTEKDIALNGYPGRRFRSMAQDGSYVDEEVFVVVRRFYLITIVSKANPPDKNIDKVFDSFRFTPLSGRSENKVVAGAAHEFF